MLVRGDVSGLVLHGYNAVAELKGGGGSSVKLYRLVLHGYNAVAELKAGTQLHQ